MSESRYTSKDRVLKQVVGTCKCGKDLKDKEKHMLF